MAITKEQAIALASARLRLQQRQKQPDLSAMSNRIESEKQGPMQRLGRSAGINARALTQGLLDLPAMAADLAAYPINAASRLSGGRDVFPPQQQALGNLMSMAGLPSPETPTESMQSSISRGFGGAIGGLGLGNQLAKSTGPVIAGIGNTLRSAPASQIIAGGAAGGSSEFAKQQGAGAAGQAIAGIAGGVGAGAMAQKMMPSTWNPNLSPQLPKGATTTRQEAAGDSGFGNTKPLFDQATTSNADRTTQYKKSVDILDRAGVKLSKGQRSGTGSTRMVETTLETLPMVGKPLQNLADETRLTYQKKLMKLAGNETDDALITRESLDRTADALSKRYAEKLKDKTVNISDDAFLTDLAAVEAKHTDIVDAGTAVKVRQIVDQFLAKASKETTFSGEKYQKQRSLFAERAKGTGSTAKLYEDLKTVMDDAFQRASGDKGKLDSQWAHFKQIEGIYNNSGGALSSEGFISPVQVARRASGAPGSLEWKDFSRAAATVLPDRLPNTGSGQRSAISNMAMGNTGRSLLTGGSAGLAVMNPMAAAAAAGATGVSMLGARGIASRLAAQPGQSPYQLNPLLFPSMSGNILNQ